jgi:DNA-binding LacI/PurR family transcriptional regulator
MNKPITIKDIAKMAGVAPSTVSRVVTNSPGVGEQTRKRIWKLVLKYNYQPNSVARSLVKQRLKTIGILVPKRSSAFFENPFFAEVLMGVAEIASEQGYDVLLYTGGREWDFKSKNILQERKVDGLLAVGLRQDDPFLPLLQENKLQVVLVNREAEDPALPWVSVDNRQGVKDAVFYLIEQGHRQIGFISGPETVQITQLRRQGYFDALRAHSILPREELLMEGDYDEESGFQAAKKLLCLKPRPTAIFASNDLMAIGALAAAKEQGIIVPQELSLFGFDNIHSSLHVDPPLSTVKIPAFKMGQLASELMLDLLAGKTPRKIHILLPTELVIRQSTGKPGGC